MSQTISELPQNLRHYSRKKLGDMRSVEQSKKPGDDDDGKPRGLWLAEGESWITDVGQYGLYDKDTDLYAYDVTLNPEARILYLDGSKPENLISFCQQYGRFYCSKEKSNPGGKGCWYDELTLDEKKKVSEKEHHIDWAKVAKTFDGIFVTTPGGGLRAQGSVMLRKMDGERYDPYIISLREIQGFLADSLCIWNKDAILKVEPAQQHVIAPREMKGCDHERETYESPSRPQANSLNPPKLQHLTAET